MKEKLTLKKLKKIKKVFEKNKSDNIVRVNGVDYYVFDHVLDPLVDAMLKILFEKG